LVCAVNTDQRNGAQWRFDHFKWDNVYGNVGENTAFGVADHNTFLTDDRGAFTLFDTFWDGGTFGDASWHDPSNVGSSQFFFIEDNTFTASSTVYQGWLTDAYGGARFVVRHNTLTNCAIGNHGTESNGRARGGRVEDVYSNVMDGMNVNVSPASVRSGLLLFHDNTVSNYWNYPPYLILNAYRSLSPFGVWGGGDGTNVWDVNSPTVFFTGTAASNSSNRTVTVTGANWTPNQWVSYVLRRLTDVGNSGTQNWSEITANTSNTITYQGAQFVPDMTIAAGDSLEIRRVLQLLDQPGRGMGSLVTGNPPVPQPDGTIKLRNHATLGTILRRARFSIPVSPG
jgi:hypothetical protein